MYYVKMAKKSKKDTSTSTECITFDVWVLRCAFQELNMLTAKQNYNSALNNKYSWPYFLSIIYIHM